jgi:hypothetical protein
MKLLFVSKMDLHRRATSPTAAYVRVGRELGHEVAVFGEQKRDLPTIPFSLDLDRADYVVFVVCGASDLPDLPYLGEILDQVPKTRRVLIDCYGRYNETVSWEQDFNHMEELDGHQGWEWIEGFRAIADTIVQPTLKPLRSDVHPFLFHGFDAAAVARRPVSLQEAARGWSGNGEGRKPYGMVYVGHNFRKVEPDARPVGGGGTTPRPPGAPLPGRNGLGPSA